MFILSMRRTTTFQGKQIVPLKKECKYTSAVSVMIYKIKQKQATVLPEIKLSECLVLAHGGRSVKSTYCTLPYRGRRIAIMFKRKLQIMMLDSIQADVGIMT